MTDTGGCTLPQPPPGTGPEDEGTDRAGHRGQQGLRRLHRLACSWSRPHLRHRIEHQAAGTAECPRRPTTSSCAPRRRSRARRRRPATARSGCPSVLLAGGRRARSPPAADTIPPAVGLRQGRRSPRTLPTSPVPHPTTGPRGPLGTTFRRPIPSGGGAHSRRTMTIATALGGGTNRSAAPPDGGLPPRFDRARREEPDMAVVSEEQPPIRSASLKREIGLIGLLWASTGSIIGSGWLFGAQKGLVTAGPAAVISWVIGGVAILVLALVHAELGGMYPVSGGSARFPHYAFGGAAGASFGWFSFLQAAIVAPIEVSAVINYATHYSFAQGWLNKDQTLTTSGLIVAIILMAIISSINFLGVRALAATNSTATWWKVGVPLLAIFAVAIAGGLHSSNFTAADGFAPDGAQGILAAVATSGIIFAYLGFEQADQLAGESKNPKRDIPFAVIGSIVIGLVIYIALQLVFLLALPSSAIGSTWASTASSAFYTAFTGPWAQLAALVGLGWLATILYIDALISPAGTGLIYTAATSRVSFGLSRNGYFPNWYERLNARAVPW